MKFRDVYRNRFQNTFANTFRNPYRKPSEVNVIHAEEEQQVELYSTSKATVHATNSRNDGAEDSESNSFGQTTKCTRSRFSGWRRGALWALFFAIACLILNVVVTVWISQNSIYQLGLLQLFRGSCTRAEKTDTWVHFGINVVSTLLLGGSNFCMQCLIAPTRLEIDRVHQQGRWLDIGVPSLRNLRTITKPQLLVWMILGLTSLPLHLIFNSAMYTSISTNDYDVLVATESFLDGAEYVLTSTPKDNGGANATQIDLQKLQQDVKSFQHLSNSECIKAYGKDIVNDRRNLIIISSNKTADSSLLYAQSYLFSSAVGLSERWYDPYAWICSDPDFATKFQVDPDKIQQGYDYTCEPYLTRLLKRPDDWAPFGFPAEYCLSERQPETCSFNANLPIIIVVCVCNFMKVLAMLYVVLLLKDDPLIVMGDAIQSFLQRPDPTTRNMCLLSRSDVTNGLRWPIRSSSKALTASADRPYWASSTSWRRWIFSVGLIMCCIGIILAMLIMGLVSSRSPSGESLENMGFGKVNAQTLIYGSSFTPSRIKNPSNRVVSAILVANIPQVILSLIYINFNGIITTMFMADEWSDFATQRKYLRVSNPRGNQRSTYFLQLPYKIILPLMAIAGLMHWLLSQSIFLAVISEWTADGKLANPLQIATCGFSILPMIIVLVMTFLIGVGLIGLGMRKYNSLIPVVGSCSAAISASCHPVEFDLDAARKALQWGAIPDSGSIGHCCFSSGFVQRPQDKKHYS